MKSQQQEYLQYYTYYYKLLTTSQECKQMKEVICFSSLQTNMKNKQKGINRWQGKSSAC